MISVPSVPGSRQLTASPAARWPVIASGDHRGACVGAEPSPRTLRTGGRGAATRRVTVAFDELAMAIW